jgi:fatty-acyl-CoA synthase
MGVMPSADEVPDTTFRITVASLFDKRVRLQPDSIALEEGPDRWTYRELSQRVNQWAHLLVESGVTTGDRVAVLSENRHEYVEIELAAARIGAIVACLNWRLADEEMLHCITLTEPTLLINSPKHASLLHGLEHGVKTVLTLDSELETRLADQPESSPTSDVDPECGLVILYTSGTTGMPKGAVISHRAVLARMVLYTMVLGATGEDAFWAWPPMFHMASTDQSLITLMLGGTVVFSDGPDLDVMCDVLSRHQVSWLIAMPGMIDRMIERLEQSKPSIRGVRAVGAMADLVPFHQIRDLTALLGAPYLNTFGSTEAGMAPASAGMLEPGVLPTSLSKHETPYCEVRLVEVGDGEAGDDVDVALETPGEMLIRGPSLFSGYWNAPQTNLSDFRGGWFHTGDMFVRHEDGTLDFVDRCKYMIKTGGENVYPAEIERHLLAHPAVDEAAVVRRRDERWGEVPVAFVALRDTAVTADDLSAALRQRLSSYKLPKAVHVITEAEFPRSTTGKVQRHELEIRFASVLA